MKFAELDNKDGDYDYDSDEWITMCVILFFLLGVQSISAFMAMDVLCMHSHVRV